MRLEAEPSRELDGTEHQVLRELEWDSDPVRLPRCVALTPERLELTPPYPLRSHRVLDAKAPRIDQVAADRQSVIPVGVCDHDESDAAVTGLRRRAGVARPIIVVLDSQPVAPARADPAPRLVAGFARISSPGSRLDRNHSDEPCCLTVADRKRTRDLARRVALRSQLTNPNE